jgi:hypothetical protein
MFTRFFSHKFLCPFLTTFYVRKYDISLYSIVTKKAFVPESLELFFTSPPTNMNAKSSEVTLSKN